jgi:hypothetical protein
MTQARLTERRLGAFESALSLTYEQAPLNATVVLQLDGAPPASVVRGALGTLQRRHPLLAVRLVGKPGRYRFEGGTVPPVPVEVTARDGDDHWRVVAEEELGRDVDRARGPLARCRLLRDAAPARGELLLTFHHSIMDATSALHLCEELLGLCAEPVAESVEKSADPAPRAPLPPAEALFPAPFRGLRRWPRVAGFALRQLADEIVCRWRSRRRRVTIPASARCRILPLSLSVEATTALVRRMRRQRSTLHSVLAAALFLATGERLFDGGSFPLRCLTFADLRPYLHPPVPAGDLGACFAMMRFRGPAPGGRGLWEVAGEIQRRVHTATRRGDKYLASLTSFATMRGLIGLGSARMAEVALSYTGPARIERRYGEIELRGLHAFVSNFPLGPEYTSLVRLFDRRLWWDVLYLDGDLDRDEARRIGERIVELLEAAGREGGPAENSPNPEEDRR